jgi:hypothetical protein
MRIPNDYLSDSALLSGSLWPLLNDYAVLIQITDCRS